MLLKTIKIILISLLFLKIVIVNVNAQVQPQTCDANMFGIKEDLIQASYHNTIAKTETLLGDGTKKQGFAVWGQASRPDGVSAQLSPLEIIPENGFMYKGDILHAVSGGTSSVTETQSVILTTEGLYAWGTEGQVLPIGATNGTQFAKVSINGANKYGLPGIFDPSQIKQLRGSHNVLAIVIKEGIHSTLNGSVYVLSEKNNALYGEGETSAPLPLDNKWHRVRSETNLGSSIGAPLRGITDLRITNTTAFAFNENTQALYSWGERVYNGNGSGGGRSWVPRNAMQPVRLGSPIIAQIALVDSTFTSSPGVGNSPDPVRANFTTHYLVLTEDGYIYSLGDNVHGVGGTGKTGRIETWQLVQNKVTDTPTENDYLSNVIFISGQDQSIGVGSASAILEGGQVLSWGNNGNQGGIGFENDILALTGLTNSIPTKPRGLPNDAEVLYIENGGHITPLVIDNGQQIGPGGDKVGLYCNVGHNENGGFGDMTTDDRSEYSCMDTELTNKLVVFNETECPPELNLTKETSSVRVLDQGKYEVTYLIGAENKGSNEASYDLVDVLNPGSNITVLAGVDAPKLEYDTNNAANTETLMPRNSAMPEMENGNNVPVVKGETIAAGAQEYWKLTVVFQHDMDNGSPEDLVCRKGLTTGRANGGFANNVNVTEGETDGTDNGACPKVPQIELIKNVTNITDSDAGIYIVDYRLTAINKGEADGIYNIIDALGTNDDPNDGVSTQILNFTYDTDLSTDGSSQDGSGADAQTGAISGDQVTNESLNASEENSVTGEVTFFQDVFVLKVEFTVASQRPDGDPVDLSCVVDGGGFASGAFANNVTGSFTEFDTTNNGACPLLPEIALVKTSEIDLGDNNALNPGDFINYTYTVTNVGGVDLFDIGVIENESAFSGTFANLTTPVYVEGGSEILSNSNDDSDIADIALDATGDEARIVFTARYTITAEDIERGNVENQATTTGDDENGNEVTDDSDDDNPFEDDPTVTLLPKIEFEKIIKDDSNDYPIYNVNDNTYTVAYEIIATNSGEADGFYNVVDQFHLGAGIELIEANIAHNPDSSSDSEQAAEGSVVPDGEYDTAGPETILVEDESLEAGSFESWTLTAKFRITNIETAFNPANNSCQQEGSISARGAFTNIVIPADVESDQTNNDACVEFPRRSVTDYVWIDWNLNGTRESQEDYVSNVRVRLDATDSNGDVIASVSPVYTSTTSNGKYSFDNLLPGIYQATLVGYTGATGSISEFDTDADGKNSDGNMNGTECLADADSTGFITLGNVIAQDYSGVGNPVFCGGVLGDTIWWDRNDNGDQETEQSVPVKNREPLLANVTVKLTGKDSIFDLEIAELTTKTNDDGFYSFGNLIPGEYMVTVVANSLTESMNNLSRISDKKIRATHDFDGTEGESKNIASYVLDYDPLARTKAEGAYQFYDLDFGYNRDTATSVEFNDYKFTINKDEINFKFETPATDDSLIYIVYGRTSESEGFQRLTDAIHNNDAGFGSTMSFDFPSAINDKQITEVMVTGLNDMGYTKNYIPIKVSPLK